MVHPTMSLLQQMSKKENKTKKAYPLWKVCDNLIKEKSEIMYIFLSTFLTVE